MDDHSRTPKDSDRSPLRDRIKRAVADGRISTADGDIRLRNVDSAQSMGELGLIVRDLDQLESSIAPAPAPVSTGTASYATPAATIAAAAVKPTRRWLAPVIAAVVLVIVGAAGLLVFVSSGDPQAATPLNDPVPFTASVSPTTDTTDTTAPSTGGKPPTAYSLSADGVRTFIATYRQRFGTTRTVSATFYGDYVVVQVPVAGGKRHSGWVYRQASGFTDFGGTTANFPGSAVIDLKKLDVAAMMSNVARAKRVLHVQNATQNYVTIDYRPQFDPAPNVNIYLTNQYGEAGYLATRLDGKVERAYPFAG
ncbi:DUF1707 SHOCT-like domain-containing protein [Nocardioides marmorisolisilvae]|uniref:DUF1707 domain-containing protein n=1 Tax=Nocardioides marmorisolisilvae TaxID=1542737 RepID=A0A3N0DQ72_9ACTN|nr:DUF1707 domain-containing protein [Nocardioides marmorisolisilvae]RNL77493.1 DUF1707 domain-containing protein [Nocardioides marmorisolisilvae]